MQLNNSWNSKTIQKQLLETRTKYSDLYRGEKYLISKFIKNNDSVLDIGCGQGGLFKILNKKYKNISYTGIDFNKNMIEFAKSNYSEAKFYYSIKNDYMKFFKN